MTGQNYIMSKACSHRSFSTLAYLLWNMIPVTMTKIIFLWSGLFSFHFTQRNVLGFSLSVLLSLARSFYPSMLLLQLLGSVPEALKIKKWEAFYPRQKHSNVFGRIKRTSRQLESNKMHIPLFQQMRHFLCQTVHRTSRLLIYFVQCWFMCWSTF